MTPQTIASSLAQITNFFRPSIVQATNYNVRDNVITWYNYKPGIAKSLAYARNYEQLLNDRQYSFLLIDDTLIQFYFEFREEQLEKARLALYPQPADVVEDKDEFLRYVEQAGNDFLAEVYLGFSDWVHKGIRVVNTSHFRIDFDRAVVTHSQSHIHVSSIDRLRLDSDCVLNPFVFFDWVVPQIISDEFAQEVQRIRNTNDYQQSLNFFRYRNYRREPLAPIPHFTF